MQKGICKYIWLIAQNKTVNICIQFLPPIWWISPISIILLGFEDKPSNSARSDIKIHFFTGSHQQHPFEM